MQQSPALLNMQRSRRTRNGVPVSVHIKSVGAYKHALGTEDQQNLVVAAYTRLQIVNHVKRHPQYLVA